MDYPGIKLRRASASVVRLLRLPFGLFGRIFVFKNPRLVVERYMNKLCYVIVIVYESHLYLKYVRSMFVSVSKRERQIKGSPCLFFPNKFFRRKKVWKLLLQYLSFMRFLCLGFLWKKIIHPEAAASLKSTYHPHPKVPYDQGL